MKNIKYLFFATILMLSACSKTDEIIPEEEVTLLVQSISGSAFIDNDIDGIGDQPMTGAYIYVGNSALINEILSQDPDTLGPQYADILFTIVDSDGSYLLDDTPTLDTALIMIYNPIAIENVVGIDNTPDGDFLEDDPFPAIIVSLEPGEHDDGNDFVAEEVVLPVLASISGYVFLDEDKDGTIDGPLVGGRMKYFRRGGSGLSLGSVLTDEDGYYEFTDVDPGEYYVLFRDAVDYKVISKGDESPDSDPTTFWMEQIYVDLVEGEVDSDNNFYVEPRTQYSFSGTVLLDSDMDGIGDTPVSGQAIEIYERDANLKPIGERVGWKNTNADGTFWFLYQDAAEYVIKLVDNPLYNCQSSGDQSIEANEPTSTDCSIIPINLETSFYEDEDNVFILTN